MSVEGAPGPGLSGDWISWTKKFLQEKSGGTLLPSFCCYEPPNPQNHPHQREVQEGRDKLYQWVIHVDVWQKPTQFCKAIILKLKNKLKKITPTKSYHLLSSLFCNRAFNNRKVGE